MIRRPAHRTHRRPLLAGVALAALGAGAPLAHGAVVSAVDTVPTGTGTDLAVAAGDGRVVAATTDGARLLLLDAQTRQVLRDRDRQSTRPVHDLAVDAGGNRLYDLETNRIVVRRLDTLARLRVIALPAAERALHLDIDLARGRLFVVSHRIGVPEARQVRLRTVVVATGERVGLATDLGERATGLAYSPALRRVLVADGARNAVAVVAYGAGTGALTDTGQRLAVADRPAELTRVDGPDGDRVALAARGGRVQLIHPRRPLPGGASEARVVATVAVGGTAESVGVSEATDRLAVLTTAPTGSRLRWIQLDAGNVMTTVESRPVGTAARRVVVDRRSHRAVVTRQAGTAQTVSRFIPAVHGFRFVNLFSTPAAVTFPGVGTVPLASIPYGLCGGMSFGALDTFLAGRTRPDDTATPNSGPVFDYVFARLTHSLTPDLLARYATLQALPLGDVGPVPGRRTVTQSEAAAIRASLEAGRPVPLGVVLVDASRPIWENHQVLAIGRSVVDGEVVIEVYDPNFPGRSRFLWTTSLMQTDSDAPGAAAEGTPFMAFFSAAPAYAPVTPGWNPPAG
ncbi:MAG TPA: hypothetical protein VNT51_13355 [Miltoncostaeaceae bacterium]|nr:hypothetical protein [Miltoncostaeaceae bacterium]